MRYLLPSLAISAILAVVGALCVSGGYTIFGAVLLIAAGLGVAVDVANIRKTPSEPGPRSPSGRRGRRP